MAVMVTAEVQGQTQEGYEGMIGSLEQSLKQAPGFVLHTAFPVSGGWRVVEFWESNAAAADFYAQHVFPELPGDIRPKRSIQELSSLVTR